MLFSKKKKLQRDRNAGLVFRWRGGYGTNRGGSTIAFLLTAMIFAAGFVMLNVYAKPNTVPSRYRATMIQLGVMDNDLKWWIEKNSPNLPLWSGNGDEVNVAGVDAQLREKVREIHCRKYRYEDVEMQEIEIGNEGIYALNNRSLPSVSRYKNSLAEGLPENDIPQVNWTLSVAADESLMKRLPDALSYGNWIPAKWRGRSVRFIIAVDPRGKVLSVNPAEWSEDVTVRDFGNWIHTIPFKAVKEDAGSVSGVVTLSVKPVKEKEKESEEDAP